MQRQRPASSPVRTNARRGWMGRRLAGLCIGVAALACPSVVSAQLGSDILYNDTPSITTYLGGDGVTVQDISPTHHNRGVFIDGTLIAKPTFPWRLEGNPWAQDYYNEKAWWGDNVRLATGTYQVTAVDLELPAPGFTWPIARSYNARQHDGTSYQTSSGYQGNNWFQMSQPQLVFHDDDSNPATREAEDRLFLIYGADRYVEFLRLDDDEDEFRAINGAAGVIQHEVNASAPDLFTYYDPFGIETVFFGFDDADGAGTLPEAKEGMLWKISDPAGNVAYVGDESSAATALGGYDGNGRITTAYDSAGRRYSYTYGSGLLTRVLAEFDFGSGWEEVGKVQYAYYTATSGGNSDKDLKRVTTTLPITDGTLDDIRVTYYRYADSASLIKYVLEPEGTRNYDWTEDGVFDEGYESAIDDDIKSYAAAGFTYDGENRLATAYFNGECGCGGGVNGEHTFTYETSAYYNANKTSAYNPYWATRTVTKLPDEPSTSASTGSLRAYFVNYFDETGQPLGRVIMGGTDGGVPGSPVVGSGGNTFAAWAERNAEGQFIKLTGHTSATAYDHSNQVGDQDPVTLSSSDGLVLYFTRVGSTGDLTGFMAAHGDREGTGGTAVLRGSFDYTTRTRTIGAATLVRPLMTESWQYMTAVSTVETGTNNSALVYASTFFSDTPGDRDYFAIKTETITWPAVPTAQNGSNSTDNEIYYFRKDGTTAFHQATDGVFTHWSQDAFGLTDLVIEDANTTSGDYDGGDDPSGTWGISEVDAGLHEDMSYEYDDQGRQTLMTRNPGGSYERVMPTHHHVLEDRRIVMLGIPRKDATKWYGPVDYMVYNQAGKVEVAATIAIDLAGTTTAPIAWIDEGDDDPVSAVDTGTVAQLAVNVYDNAGTSLDEARVFHTIEATLAGMDEEDYDPTSYAYDHRGRVIQTTSPKGTIQTYEHDIRGNYVTASFVDGSLDSPTQQRSQVVRQETRGPTGPPSVFSNPNVMAGVNPVNQGDSYGAADPADGDDGEGDGEGAPETSQCIVIAFNSSTTTTFTRDYRGRVVIRQNPEAPHLLVAYDNRDRITEVGYYSSVSGLAVGDTPSTETGNRLALVTLSHDSRGTTWQTVRHNIDASDGSSDDMLAQFVWADERGRTIKSAAASLEKILYDSLGRSTHRFILAKDNDANSYASVADPTLSGDHVLEEWQTAYEPHTGNTLFSATIRRHHGDTSTTGRLDDNADTDAFAITATNIEGRAEIVGYWYDEQDRLIDKVAFGTYGLNDGGPSSFDRTSLSTAPVRSDSALRTSYAFNTDGELETLTDPRDIDTTYEYDPMGRVVLRIANDTGATPPISGDTRDNDIYTRITYGKSSDVSFPSSPWVDKLWLDFDGDGDDQDAGNQITQYTYGGPGSIVLGDFLKSVTYPDGGVETYGYHSSGILTSSTEPIGPSDTLSTTYGFDNIGRHTSATMSIPSGVDNLVTGVAWDFDDLGRLASVTQSGGSGTVDQIVYEYDGWGNIAKIRQDHDSVVGAGGGVPTHDVAFAHTDAIGGARTLRCTSMTLPNSNAVQYRYYGNNGSLDDAASRVSAIGRGNTDYVQYGYLGLDHVVGIEYPVTDVFRRHYGTTAGTYPTLDRFDRVVHDRWTKDLTTDVHFFDQDWSYDRNHNPLVADDHVHPTLFDMAWTIDDINRVVQAERGEWSSGSITTLAEDENWELTTVGGWAQHTLDGDGDGFLTGADDLDVTGTLNVANEITTRVDAAPSPDETYNLLYNDRGDLTDDGQAYKYTYDAFGRLREVRNQSNSLLAEYRYNGLGYLIAVHHDTDIDGDVDSSDAWLRLVYDNRWRVVAEHLDDEAKPHAVYVHHAGGVWGSGSYIDELAFRERDADADMSQVLEERRYYAQNWRKDVVAMLTGSGELVEQVRYSSYGVPYGLPAGDTDSDGDFDLTDLWAITGSYDVRKDTNLDGTIDISDQIHAGNMAGSGGFVTTGRDALGSPNNANRFGYGAYLRDPAVPQWHVRNRVLRSDIGRWLTRDPAGYVDGLNLYQYVGSMAVFGLDPFGLQEGDPLATPPQLAPVELAVEIAEEVDKWLICLNQKRAKQDVSNCYANGNYPVPVIKDDGKVDVECHANATAAAIALLREARRYATGWSRYQQRKQEANPAIDAVLHREFDPDKVHWYYYEGYQDILEETLRRHREQNPPTSTSPTDE